MVHLSWKHETDDGINDVVAVQPLNFKTRKRSRSKFEYFSSYQSISSMIIQCRGKTQRVKEERYSINVYVSNNSNPVMHTLYRSDDFDELASIKMVDDWLCVNHVPQPRGKSAAVGVSVCTQCHWVDRMIFEVFLLEQPTRHEF